MSIVSKSKQVKLMIQALNHRLSNDKNVTETEPIPNI